MGVEPLLAAVHSRDAEAVHALLDAGADPEVTDEHGTPILCLTVDTFAVEVVEALVISARLDRVAPDGRTALLRAVDRGAYDIVEMLIARGAAMWHTDPEGRDALALARYWHETGAAEMLRRRTSQPAPAACRTVASSDGTTCEELSTGALTVRTGHSAILTALEPRYGITVSFGELLARAIAEPDVDHGVWWATTHELQHRHDPVSWEAAASLRTQTDPLKRYFGAEVLRLTHLFDDSPEDPYDGPLTSLFLPWVAQEPDPRVVRALTAGLAEARDPRAEQRLPALARHPDARVRQRAVGGLHRAVTAGDPDALAAVVERAADAEAAVRRVACTALGAAPPCTAAASDALAARLTDADEGVRVEAAARLALRDDPRGADLLEALAAPDEASPYYWLLYDVHRHRLRGR
ncbi:ankyrin repeat domain-containing protein [Streptomyces sp. ME01-24h]|nr:ankyrin repeat domain-containing protein [Streptomyces sp. ME01-24h]